MSSSGAQASITLKEALFPKWKRTGHKLRELLQDSSPMPMALMPAHTCQPLLYHLVHVVPAVALNPGSGKAMGKGPEGPRCSRRARHTACFLGLKCGSYTGATCQFPGLWACLSNSIIYSVVANSWGMAVRGTAETTRVPGPESVCPLGPECS